MSLGPEKYKIGKFLERAPDPLFKEGNVMSSYGVLCSIFNHVMYVINPQPILSRVSLDTFSSGSSRVGSSQLT